MTPWHGTWEDKPEWDRPGFTALLLTATALWAVAAAEIRWLVRRLR